MSITKGDTIDVIRYGAEDDWWFGKSHGKRFLLLQNCRLTKFAGIEGYFPRQYVQLDEEASVESVYENLDSSLVNEYYFNRINYVYSHTREDSSWRVEGKHLNPIIQ